jgi:hypothetical protein
MDWYQVLFLFFANSGLLIWFRAESRSDWRHMDAKIDAQLLAMRQESQAQINAIREDMKDFHGRLCAIEERSNK